MKCSMCKGRRIVVAGYMMPGGERRWPCPKCNAPYWSYRTENWVRAKAA